MTERFQFWIDCFSTPIGPMMIAADADGNLRAVLFTDEEEMIRRQMRFQVGKRDLMLEAAQNPHGLTEAILKYFAGDLGAIDALPVETGGTPFQQAVLSNLAPGDDPALERLQLDLVARRNREHLARVGADPRLEARIAAGEMSFRLQKT